MSFEITQESFSILSAPLIGVMILIEIIISNKRKMNAYSVKDTFTNFYLTAVNILLSLLTHGFYLWFYSLLNLIFNIEWTTAPLYWGTLLIFQDFLFYILHYIDHHSRLFWAVHITHHSSLNYNFTVGFRSSVFQPMYRFLFYAPLALVGFKALDIMLMFSITQIWGIFLHTKTVKKLPSIVEYLFVTPSHHRVHHASNPIYLDKNMGMLLVIWDRLFGTFQKELEEEPVQYGLTNNPENRGPFNIIFHEFSSIFNQLKQKELPLLIRLKYAINPPGWSHDGSQKTSKQLQEIYAQKKAKE